MTHLASKTFGHFDWSHLTVRKYFFSKALKIGFALGFCLEKKCLNLKLNHPSKILPRSIFTDTKAGITAVKALIKKCRTAQSVKSYLKAGEAVGKTIECMDGSFNVHEWCLYHSDILFDFLEGKLFKMWHFKCLTNKFFACVARVLDNFWTSESPSKLPERRKQEIRFETISKNFNS